VKAKILFLISSLGFGGAEKQTIDLINNMNEDQFEIYLCYFEKIDPLKSDLCLDNLAGIHCLNKKHTFSVKELLKLNRVLRNAKPDIVVCVNLYPSLYAHILKIIYKFKIIQVMHSTIIKSKYLRLINLCLYVPLSNRSNAIVFVCKKQMEYWLEKYNILKNKCRCIYNGVDTNHFNCSLSLTEKNKLKKNYGIQKGEFVIGICASLRKEKRHVDLISAGSILLKKKYPIKILIIGDGVERKNIENHITNEQMGNNVIITGFQKDVRSLIEISDVMCIVSDSIETFSIAVLESMSLSKAIIASDVGGASEQVDTSKNGYLFPPGDIQTLSLKLEKLIKKENSKVLGIESRKMVCSDFSIEMMTKAYTELFENLQLNQ